nr:transglutaminase domain-containing protein [Massilia sp. Se16.2.3]
MRYLSLSLGENSHRPAPPAEVLARRYGDCKDKSLLLVTMLRALGLEADPVLVSVALHKNMGQYLPSPMLFDHAIVRLAIGGRTYFLDPTRQGQHGQLARLGQPLAGAEVLVVHPGSAGLDGIAYPPAPERQRRSEQVTVTAMDAPASLLVRSEYSGAGAETLRANSAMATQAEMKKSLGDAMARRYPEAQLVGDVVLRDDRERNVMVLESQFTVPRMFSESATAWTVDYNAVNMADLLQVPGAGQRSAPLTVPGYPYAVDYEMTLRLPESFAMREDSESRTVADPAFNGTRKITLGKRGLKLELQLNLLADRIEAARTVEFSRKLQAWDMQRAGTLRVFKADMQGTPVAPPNEEARQRAALVKLDQAVQDAERSGREPGRALCERARVRAHLGQAQDAIKDATRAVKLQDQADGLLACRAEVYLLTGRVAEAKADFTRVIARGQGEPATWFPGAAWPTCT